MASSRNPSSSSSASSSSTAVSQFEFNAFHRIDRTLFARLILSLKRDPYESLQIMAFLLWLEQSGQSRNLVACLIPLQNQFIHALFNEAILCLNCVRSDCFNIKDDKELIPIIRRITKDQLSLKNFYDNRSRIAPMVEKIILEVCTRAFEDIIGIVVMNDVVKNVEDADDMVNVKQMMMNKLYGYEPSDARLQEWVSNDERGITREMSRIKINGSGSGGRDGVNGTGGSVTEDEVSVDDRTIFLTFSKGYPISDAEVIHFFTRRFGGIIKEIHMQEVPEEEQPLYARLVLNSASAMGMVLKGRDKPKFTINGKHVWARKYVTKTRKSPSPKSSSPARSFS